MPKRFPRTGTQTGSETRSGAKDRGQDRGQAAIEFAGLITLLLFIGLTAIQLGLAAYAVQQAGTASRAAARAASLHDAGYDNVGKSSMSDWLADEADIRPATYFGDEVKVTARVPVPAILPIFDFGPAERSATMPLD